MPNPTTFSALVGRGMVVELVNDGTNVPDERDFDDRHLKDISEYIGRAFECL